VAPLRIRPATAADGPRMLELDRLTWSPLTTPGPPPPPDRDVFARRAPQDHLVAEVDGAVVGVVNLGHPTELEASRHVVEIQGITVHPDHLRRGIGRALLQAATEEAARRGARKVSLRVLAPNDGARRLYDAEGFEVEGVLRGEFVIDGEPVDDVLMARHLT
jgi:ribosomal protein S18 acetylase RimI-like enzyme